MTHDVPFARPFIGDEEIDAVVEVLRSGWLTTGPRTRTFEVEFGAAVGGAPALAVSSGTAAMHLALVALGVAPGDRVLTTPLTFCSTAHVIDHVGAVPLLVDVDPRTLNLDAGQVEHVVTEAARRGERVAAIMPVHYAGLPCAMPDLLALARDHDLAVVEDAAHAFGSTIGGRPVGVVEDDLRHAVAFSLYATKNITTGEGGVLSAAQEVVDVAREWSLHGMTRDAWRRYERGGAWRYDVVHPGFKYNFTDIQAALGLVQLRRAGELLARRRLIAERYTAAFSELDELQPPSDDPGHAWHLYVLRLNLDRLTIDRDAFIDELVGLGIGMSVHFIPLYEHTYYRETYGWTDAAVPTASREFRRILSLPIYPRMTDEDIDSVIAAVRDVVARHRARR